MNISSRNDNIPTYFNSRKIKAVLIVKSKEYENCLDSLVDNKSWQIRNVLVEAKNYELCYGTLHYVRKRTGWVKKMAIFAEIEYCSVVLYFF